MAAAALPSRPAILASFLALAACARPIPHPPACAVVSSPVPVAPPKPRPPDTSFVHQAGLALVDGDGRPFELRGTNLGGWLLWEGWIWGAKLHILSTWGQAESAILERLADVVGPDATCRFKDAVDDRFVTESDIAAISEAGFNVVRVPLNHRDFASESSAGWRVLDRLLDWCEAHRVYAVLELHSAPGGQSKWFVADPEPVLLWDSAEAQDRTVALWKSLAARYSGRAIVAGYDLLNEPRPDHDADLVALDRRIASAIRSVDPHHLLIVEGTDFARDFSMFHAPLDDNQVYSFHMYSWFGDDRERRLRGYAAVSAAQGVPMWCGEFGENTLPILETTLDMFDASSPPLVGWSFWTWKRGSASRWATLRGITLPPGWVALIEWMVNDSGQRPTSDAGLRAMTDFLDASAVSRLTSDPRLVATLSAHARR